MSGAPLGIAIAVVGIMALPGIAAGGIVGPPACSVSIDKQVDCGGGFIDIGDVNETCIGWNQTVSTVPPMPAETIAVRWVIENTGQDGLVNCTLAESNPALGVGSSVGALAPGAIATLNSVKACSANLSAAEPDSAKLVCDCATDEPGNPPVKRTTIAEDSASFSCQSPGLNVQNRCVPQLDSGGGLYFDFEIYVRNPTPESNGATLENCIVEDGIEMGACTAQTNPEPTLFDDAGTVPPQSESVVVFPENTVDSLSCNVATVTCDIRDSVGDDGPKQLTTLVRTTCNPLAPLPDCNESEKQSISIRSGDVRSGTGKFSWKWRKGEATSIDDFGDPTTDTDYQVCLYYSGFGAPKKPSCSFVPAGMGWKETKKGFKYKGGGNSGGVTKINLKSGEAGKAKIQVKKNRVNTLLPLTAAVVQQISNSEGQCWESVFTDFKKNNLKKFDAK